MPISWIRLTARGLLAAGLVVLLNGSVWAQSNSIFGSRAPVSPSQSGYANGLTGGGFQSSSSPFGGSGSGSRTSGSQSGFGMGSQSGAGMGMSGTGSGGGAGFVGRSDNAGRFVGNAQVGNQQTGGGRGGQFSQFGGAGGFNRFGGGGSQGGYQGFNMNQGQNGENAPAGTARLLHPQQRVAFTYQPPPASAPSKALATRFEHLASRPALRGVNGLSFDMDGNVLIVRGSVNNEETKRLVGMMAGLEPGVHRVRNEITVQGSIPAPPPALDDSVPTRILPKR